MTIDTAIARIQALALSSTDTEIKSAPSYPVEDANVLPLAITYIKSGQAQADDASAARLLLTVGCDVHFSRISLKQACIQINLFVPEFLKRLSGDPTLNGAVDTIVYPVTFQVVPVDFNGIPTLSASFDITLKFREAAL